MAQLDVYRTDAGEYLMDFQSDMLDHLSTRFVIPLISPATVAGVIDRLNPQFEIDGEVMALYVQYALTVSKAELHAKIGSLSDHRYTIMSAMDMLISGY